MKIGDDALQRVRALVDGGMSIRSACARENVDYQNVYRAFRRQNWAGPGGEVLSTPTPEAMPFKNTIVAPRREAVQAQAVEAAQAMHDAALEERMLADLEANCRQHDANVGIFARAVADFTDQQSDADQIAAVMAMRRIDALHLRATTRTMMRWLLLDKGLDVSAKIGQFRKIVAATEKAFEIEAIAFGLQPVEPPAKPATVLAPWLLAVQGTGLRLGGSESDEDEAGAAFASLAKEVLD